jgi:hypothetical protein
VAAERLDDAYAADLLRRQDALQAEARRVVAELDLPALLARAGRPAQIGSSQSGLMAWRDLDFTIVCPGADAGRVFDALRPLLVNPRVVRLRYENETGPRSPSGQPADERYYAVVHYETAAGDLWKIDLSFWSSPLAETARGEPDHWRRLAERLTPETRLAILWLKDVWHRLPVYPDAVSSTEVYDAVLAHGVRTPGQFDAYLRARGLPARD